MYGQATAGVVCSTLLAQRRAVAAAYSRGAGHGDLDLSLGLSDASPRGRADSAFAAHEAPVGTWAEAVWGAWLPPIAMTSLVSQTLARTQNRVTPWVVARGPGAAFVISAQRLRWRVVSATILVTDSGHEIRMDKDSPAVARCWVREAVWRWRCLRLGERCPHLRQGPAAVRPFLQPILRLLEARDAPEWGLEQTGALRSATTGRQRPQLRRQQAGRATSKCCQLCVRLGRRAADSADPADVGALLHRTWTCPALAAFRARWAPPELLLEITTRFRVGALSSAELAWATRARAPSPAPTLPQALPAAYFTWVVEPGPDALRSFDYSDASLQDA
jgi:hypothetical protein